jgi:hypothetical protein
MLNNTPLKQRVVFNSIGISKKRLNLHHYWDFDPPVVGILFFLYIIHLFKSYVWN